jgi:hypothetical protein
MRLWSPRPPQPAPPLSPGPRPARSLVAAAQVLDAGRDRITPADASAWQRQAWDHYDAAGEYGFGVEWLAGMVSQIRLYVADRPAGNAEPAPTDAAGPMALLEELSGGIGGQGALLGTLVTHLTIPGESYLVGDPDDPLGNLWQARSADEIRNGRRQRTTSGTARTFEVLDDETATSARQRWRSLDPDTADIVRLWRPHKRWHYRADSPSRRALPGLRRLDLVNRHIDATLLSRIASAGMILLPQEATFPVPEQFDDAPDPFVAAWIDAARTAIATPGTAAAVVPLPLKVPADTMEHIKHVVFSTPLDERILAAYEKEVRALATAMDLPAEILLGMGDLNHWTAWQVSEEGIKAHIAPLAELICHNLTVGYLWPRLGGGPDARRFLVWYDTAELALRPDRSEQAVAAYDRLELSPDAYRREVGFDPADAPTPAQVAEMAWKRLAASDTLGPTAISRLGGGPAGTVPPPGNGNGIPPPLPPEPPAQAPPRTRNAPPPPPGPDVPAAAGNLRDWPLRPGGR